MPTDKTTASEQPLVNEKLKELQALSTEELLDKAMSLYDTNGKLMNENKGLRLRAEENLKAAQQSVKESKKFRIFLSVLQGSVGRGDFSPQALAQLAKAPGTSPGTAPELVLIKHYLNITDVIVKHAGDRI